jgi:hypothetical protein
MQESIHKKSLWNNILQGIYHLKVTNFLTYTQCFIGKKQLLKLQQSITFYSYKKNIKTLFTFAR